MADKVFRSKPKTGLNWIQFYAFAHVLIPLFLILLGFPFATQHFARSFDYQPSLGAPLFVLFGTPIYAPWMIIAWAIRYFQWQPAIPTLYNSSLWVGGFSVGGVLLWFFMSYARGLIYKNDNLYGSARWAKLKDLENAGLLMNNGVVCGQTLDAHTKIETKEGDLIFKGNSNGTLIAHNGNTSTILIAPSRSGKGISSVIPTILSWPGSMIIFDPKGENYELTAGFRKKFSHVMKFSPLSRESIHINPLMEIRPGDRYFDDASNIADILMSPGADRKNEDGVTSHFNDTARDLITGIILHVISCPSVVDKSLGGVLDCLSYHSDNDSGPGDAFLKSMISSYHVSPDIHDTISKIASSTLMIQDRERASVYSTARRGLNLFRSPLIRQNTADHDFYIESFFTSKSPITLYLTVPFSDIDRLSPVFRIIVTYILRRLSEGETSHDTIHLKNRLLFLLDEFPVLGTFPFIEKTMGILAGYGATFFLICQSLQQVIKLYGEHNPFLEHCKTLISYAPGDYHSAKLLSDIIGKDSVSKESVSVSGQKTEIGMKGMNVSYNEVERNLINPDEIMKLPRSHCLIMSHGMPPYVGKKVIYFLDNRFKSRVGIVPPKTRAEMLKEIPKGDAKNPWVTSPDDREHSSVGGFSALDELSNETIFDPQLADPFFNTPPKEDEKEGQEIIDIEGSIMS